MLLKSEYSFDINKAKQITTLGGKKKTTQKNYMKWIQNKVES